MIDNDYQIKKEEKKEYPPLPRNIFQVELLDIELKDAKGKYAKPGDKNFTFQFTLLAGRDKEQDLRGRNVWNNFVPTSLYIGKNGKNTLYQIVEAFGGRELTPQEEAIGLSGELLNGFIGRQIKIFVDHKLSNGKIFNQITSYMPIEQSLAPLNVEEKENARVKVRKEEVKPDDLPSEPEVNFDEPPMPENDGLTDEQRNSIE